jgi:hypothetical protein
VGGTAGKYGEEEKWIRFGSLKERDRLIEQAWMEG